MEENTAGQKGKRANIAFKTTEQDKAGLKIMCAELGITQQDMLAAMVHTFVHEYKHDPEVVKALIEEARKRA